MNRRIGLRLIRPGIARKMPGIMRTAPVPPQPVPPVAEGHRWVRAGLAVAVLLGLPLLVTGDVLFSADRVLSHAAGDTANLFLGFRAVGFGELARGRLMQWNPYLYGGAPFFAGFQSALLYPPNWLYAILPLRAATNWDVTLHLWLGGALAYGWAAHRGLRPAARLLAGTVFTFGGAHFLHLYVGHLPQLCTLAWAPLVFWSIDGTIDAASARTRAKWVLIGAAGLVAQVLAGFPQYVLYTGFMAAAYGAARVAGLPGGWRRCGAVAGLACLVAGALGLSAVQWVAALGIVGQSVRSRLPFEAAASYSLPPENLLTLLAPGAFGNIEPVPYWGRWYLWEMMLFVGIAPLTLAAFAVVRGVGRWRWLALGIIAASLLLAMGDSTPAFRLAYDWLPGVASFRGASKFKFAALPFLAMLAGMGMDRLWATGQGRRANLGWAMGAATVAAALLGICLWLNGTGAQGGAAWADLLAKLQWNWPRLIARPDAALASRLARQAATAALWAAATCAAVAALWGLAAVGGGRYHRTAALGLAVLGAVELVIFARAYRPSFSYAKAQREEADVRIVASRLPPDSRVVCDTDVLRCNDSATMRARVPGAWGTDATILQRYREFAVAAGHPPQPQADPSAFPFARVSSAWGALRLAALLGWQGDNLVGVTINVPRLPRAALMDSWRAVPRHEQLLAEVASDAWDPSRQVLLETEPVFPASPSGAAQRQPVPATSPTTAAAVKVVDVSTDELDIEAIAPRPCVLLITDNYADGWRAESLWPDGPQAAYEVLPADCTFRAIPLAAGHHRIRLKYRPAAFAVGKWISIASMLAWLLGILWYSRSGKH